MIMFDREEFQRIIREATREALAEVINDVRAAANTKTATKKMLKTCEVAEMTNISKKTIEQYRLDGRGPAYVKLGKSVLYDVADIEAWLAEHLVKR